MLIVEGPDGAGKTTLIEKLRFKFGLEVAPRVVSKDAQAMTDLASWVEQNVATNPNMIFDRHRLVSEPIYGPILRKEQAPKFQNVGWLMHQMEAFYACRPMFIFCLPPIQVVKQNILGDVTNRVVWNHIDAIYTGYTARAAMEYARSPYSTVIYDYTRDGVEDDPLACLNHWTGIINYRKENQ